MTAEQFAYWLQGFAELNEQPPTAEQWQAVRDHLALVFNKVTPNRVGPIVPHSPTSDRFPYDMHPRVTCAAPGGTAARAVC